MNPARDDHLENLEFPALLQKVASYATFSGGRALVLGLSPMEDVEAVTRVHRLAEELQRRLGAGEGFSCAAAEEAVPALARLQVANLDLEVRELLHIQDLAACACRHRRLLLSDEDLYPELTALGRRFPPLEAVDAYIAERIDPDGEVPDRASPELASVRRELRNVGERIQAQYHRVMEAADRRGILQDRFVTSRNNRFVIPIRSESQGALGGVVHGSSSSGLTVFMEPLELVTLNNSYISLKEREFEIVQRILSQITAFLRARLKELDAALDLLAIQDSLGARARFALEFRCIAPLVDVSRALKLEDARHPLLEASLKAQGKRIVPISLALTAREPRLIISGPNTGGKTAALKCAGLLTLMALSGVPVPARHMECAPFHAVRAVIGDRQSLAADLSTFSSHVLLLREILDHYRHPTLVLVDELCAGTDPTEGGALAMAILDHLRALEAPFIVTTHSRTLKEYAVNTPGTSTAAVEVDPETLEPTYRLHVGALGGSSGLFIARKLGLPDTVVAAAEQRLAEWGIPAEEAYARINELVRRREAELAEVERLKREQVLRKIELERRAEERKREEISRLRREFETYRKTFEDDRSRLADEFRRLAEKGRPIPHFEQRLERLEQRLAEAVTELTLPPGRPDPRPKLEPLPPGEIREGMEVVVGPIRLGGTVREVGADVVTVLSGGKRLQVPPDWLMRAGDSPAAPGGALPPVDAPPGGNETGDGPTGTPPAETPGALFPSREIKVIGKTVDEALPEVERFLDSAFLQEERCVAVIHGIGRGILRAAIHARLREIPFVRGFHHPPAREGGKGKTLVVLDV
ncbi:MAG: Smr/MutS family protein [Acidobacteria bacterium]|nr:Smr/MutS family protein [Acidobacteriota bacterium]